MEKWEEEHYGEITREWKFNEKSILYSPNARLFSTYHCDLLLNEKFMYKTLNKKCIKIELIPSLFSVFNKVYISWLKKQGDANSKIALLSLIFLYEKKITMWGEIYKNNIPQPKELLEETGREYLNFPFDFHCQRYESPLIISESYKKTNETNLWGEYERAKILLENISLKDIMNDFPWGELFSYPSEYLFKEKGIIYVIVKAITRLYDSDYFRKVFNLFTSVPNSHIYIWDQYLHLFTENQKKIIHELLLEKKLIYEK